MVYNHRAGIIVPFAQKYYKQLILAVAAIAMATMSAMTWSAGAVPATSGTKFQVKPWVYDPDSTRASVAMWKTKVGLKDAGKSNHGLYLTKNATTPTLVASGATVNYTGTLDSLGFDYWEDGWCGAGAPRFNVYTEDGTYYFLGCTYGTHIPSTENSDWMRVEFNNADAQQVGATSWPGFGNVEVTGLDIVFDEGTDVGPGEAIIDNIQINGVYAGKPGITQ